MARKQQAGLRYAIGSEGSDDCYDFALKMETPNDELLLEYRFDYAQANLNRFASHEVQSAGRVVLLDEDVAKVFTTPESVNKVLRALIASMPQRSDEETV